MEHQSSRDRDWRLAHTAIDSGWQPSVGAGSRKASQRTVTPRRGLARRMQIGNETEAENSISDSSFCGRRILQWQNKRQDWEAAERKDEPPQHRTTTWQGPTGIWPVHEQEHNTRTSIGRKECKWKSAKTQPKQQDKSAKKGEISDREEHRTTHNEMQNPNFSLK
jgi:hypothetical protein